VRFGAFEFDPDSGVLHRQGRRVPLQEQPARILALLTSRPGEVVTREELRHLVWTDDTFVEFDASLNAAITKIRRALGDSASAPRFVETLPKRGYRFLADVQGLPPRPQPPTDSPAVAPAPAIGSVDPDTRPAPEDAGSSRSTARTGLAVAASLSVGLLAAWWLSDGRFRPSSGQPSPASLVRAITVEPFEIPAEEPHSNLGTELAAAIGRRLSRLATLTVKPWPPGVVPDRRAVSRELGVDGRLSGAVTRTGSQLAIALRLVSTDDDRTVWEDAVRVPATDLMWLESQIAQRVGAALEVPMSGRERAALARHMTENLDAYQWFLRGRRHFDERTGPELRNAIAAFERATASDPSYALAYAWIANTYAPLSYFGFAPPSETGPAQRAAAEKALLLDDSLAEAHLSLAMALAFHERRWGDAEAAFTRALELDPHLVSGHHWYAFFLTALGRYDEALARRRRALEIDPLTPMLSVGLAEVHLARRQPAVAIETLDRLLARHPRFWFARLIRGQALGTLGRHEEALQDLTQAERSAPQTFPVSASLVGALVATGDLPAARRRVAEAEALARSTFVPAFELGLMRTAVGDVDTAFDWLRRSCDRKEPGLTGIGFHVGVDPLRDDPRFAELLACMGLPAVSAAASP
jgi:DNA-binding winged helix-turn-helix (wHTH) protein/tetratricopeptide (TPR) repeat protein